MDDYSSYNLGTGVSTQVGMLNFYGMIGNILQFNDIAATKNVSLQLGVNLIFN